MMFAPTLRPPVLADALPEPTSSGLGDVVITLVVAAAVVGLIVFAFIAVQRRAQRREEGDPGRRS